MSWILDLCSGLGGASEPFVDCPGWDVIRIENNVLLEGVPHTRVESVLNWIDWLPELISLQGRPCVVWASPPCLEFSQAYEAPGPRASREGIHFDPDMSIVEACIDIIDYCQPRYWVIENVAGACPHFLPELGKHRQRIGCFFLWGNFPFIALPEGWIPHKSDNDVHSSDPLRANKRAFIPRELSESFLDAVSLQTNLADWA